MTKLKEATAVEFFVELLDRSRDAYIKAIGQDQEMAEFYAMQDKAMCDSFIEDVLGEKISIKYLEKIGIDLRAEFAKAIAKANKMQEDKKAGKATTNKIVIGEDIKPNLEKKAGSGLLQEQGRIFFDIPMDKEN